MLQYCPTVCDPMDYSPPTSSLYGISQARILEWVAMPSSRGSSQPKDQSHVSCVSCIAGGFFTHWVIREFKHSNKEIDSYQVKLEKIHCLIWVSLGKGNPQLFEQSYCSTSEKAMAPHSSTLAWKIPWTEEPGGLQSMGVTESRTWLNDFIFTFHFHALEKEMATHPSVLAWRIPGSGEPGGLPSMESHRVGHDWSDLAAAAAL